MRLFQESKIGPENVGLSTRHFQREGFQGRLPIGKSFSENFRILTDSTDVLVDISEGYTPAKFGWALGFTGAFASC